MNWKCPALVTATLAAMSDDQPECDVCQCPLAVKHMIECVDYTMFGTNTLSSLQ